MHFPVSCAFSNNVVRTMSFFSFVLAWETHSPYEIFSKRQFVFLSEYADFSSAWRLDWVVSLAKHVYRYLGFSACIATI